MSLAAQGAESRGLFQWISRLLDTPVTDARDFKSGILLIRLVELLFDEKIKPGAYKLTPRNDFDMVINNDCALNFLKSKGVTVVNCSGNDIVSGNVKAVLGTLSTMFFKCQLQVSKELAVGGGDPLLKWVQRTLEPTGIKVTNWVSSWADGKAIYALLATALPSRLNLGNCAALSPADRESQAILACQSFNIATYITPGDIIKAATGSKIVRMVIQEIYTYSQTSPPPPPEVEPPVEEVPPPAEKIEPPVEEIRPPEEEIEPPAHEIEPPVEEVRPPEEEIEPPTEEPEIPWFDTSLPKPPTKFTLGIDLGSSKLRYNLFSTDDPSSAIDAQVIDARANVDRSGGIFVTSEGVPPPPDSAPLPSLQRLFGRKFGDPSIASVISHYPLPIVEDSETHQCAVDLGGGLITPERVATTLLASVREKAGLAAGEEVVDVSIGVPALFTSAQRTAVRTAAESAGLNVSHIASGPLLAARAMKATGQLETLGQALIVDVGASKTEVSLVHNTGDTIRELRTVGTDAIGSDDVRDNIVGFCLPLLENVNEPVDPFTRVKLCSAVELALEKKGDARRIIVPDLGNGKSFEKKLTDSEVALACEPIMLGLKELIGEIVNPEDKIDVKSVRCVGGGTMLSPLQDTFKTEFPDADFAQLDPNATVVWGATLDSAQATNRLPQEKRTTVIAVAPYSIGTPVTAGVISFLIYRGEPLPTSAESSFFTVKDNQTISDMSLYQGDHFFSKWNDLVGEAELTDLPPMPRGKCSMTVRVEYDCNGILQLSARETSTGQSLNSTFVTKTEFTEEDKNRLSIGSNLSRQAELKMANVQWLREQIRLDLVQAESETGGQDELIKKWYEWLAANEDGTVRMFIEKRHQVKCEFHEKYPEQWEMPDPLQPDPQFTVIWPVEPTFVDKGAAIIRILTGADHREIAFMITNIATNVVTRDFEIAQFPVGDKIETIARICFPENGRYTVIALAGVTGQSTLFGLEEAVYINSPWKFDVQGAPPPNRPLARLITDRPVPPLDFGESLQVTPGESTVRVLERVYNFTCRFQGELEINGREPNGEPKQTFFPKMTTESGDDGWSVAQCSIEFPSDGIWRLIFWIGDDMVAIQKFLVGPGGMLAPTNIERVALKAPFPVLPN